MAPVGSAKVEEQDARGRWLPVVVLLLSAVVIGLWWQRVVERRQRSLEEQLGLAASRVTAKIGDRLQALDGLLLGGAGHVATSAGVTREQWHRYVENLDLAGHFRGVQGVGLARRVLARDLAALVAEIRASGVPDFGVWPEGDRAEYAVTVFLEPASSRNRRVIGLDAYAGRQQGRPRAAMESARDAGAVAVSRKITLFQEDETNRQAGVLLYAPVYSGGAIPSTVEERRASISGWVYCALRMGDLLTATIGADLAELRLQVFDGASPEPDGMLHDSHPALEAAEPVSLEVPLSVGGHAWTLRYQALPAFLAAPHRRLPWDDLVVAAAIASLLAWLAWAMERHRLAQRRAEALVGAVTEAEGRFREIAERLPVGVFILQDRVITYANPAAGEILGVASSEMTGRTLSWYGSLLDPEASAELLADHDRVLRGEASRLEGYRLRRPDGARRHVERASRPILEQGRPAVLTVLLDITDRERTEEELRRAQRLESLALLASGLAHDFNNLLGAVFGHAEVARASSPPGSSAARELDVVLSALDRARNLTRQLLTFAAGGAPRRQLLSVSRLVSDEVAMALSGSNVRARVEIEDGLPAVEADPGQVSQILGNLVLNAREAMPGGGEVLVTAVARTLVPGEAPDLPPGRYVEVRVQDEGAGIPADLLPRVFDPFFTTKPGGTGLGLSTSYSIARRHGGRISIDSGTTAGTTVRLLLPASDSPAHDPVPTSGPPSGLTPRPGLRVLLMDDEPMLVQVGMSMLESLGCHVDPARTGEEAVDIYRRARDGGRPYQVVILDLTVAGGIGGEEAVRRLRAADPRVLAVACSGYSEGGAMSDPARFGFAAALPKPYTLRDLARVLDEALRER